MSTSGGARERGSGRRAAPRFEFSGGTLALDFTNTVDNRPVESRKDLLRDYADLVAWGAQAGVVTRAEGRTLEAALGRRRPEAARVMARAVALREALYRAFSALAAGRQVDGADLSLIEGELRVAGAHARLAREGARFAWGWDTGPGALDRMIWPVARDAAELLLSGRLPRLRECGADDCGWLFLDESKNRSRVWCNMRVCGNRAKAKRHYLKARGRP